MGLGSLKSLPVERLGNTLVAFGVLHGKAALAQGLGEVFAPALPAYDDDGAALGQRVPDGQGEGGFAVVAVLRCVDVGEALLAQGLGGLAADGDVWDFCFQAAYMGCGDFCGGGAHPKQGLGGGDGLRQPEKGVGDGRDADGGKGDGLPACGGAGGDVGGEAVFGADKEDGGHGGEIGIGWLFQVAY